MKMLKQRICSCDFFYKLYVGMSRNSSHKVGYDSAQGMKKGHIPAPIKVSSPRDKKAGNPVRIFSMF